MQLVRLARAVALGVLLVAAAIAAVLGVGIATAGPFDPSELVAPLALCSATVVLAALALLTRSRVAGGLLSTVLLVELLLQLLAALRWIPMVCVLENAPYGRVYWMTESRNASVMNRRGWHYPRVDYSPQAERRIAIVGDSFVEALEVQPEENMGVWLEQLAGEGTEVMAFGRGKTGPGHYLETVRYVLDRHKPDDVVLLTFLGNDFSDSQAPELNATMPGDGHELYYSLSGTQLVFDPRSPVRPEQYRARLEANDGAYPVNLARSVGSWILLPAVVDNLVRHAQAVALFPQLAEARSDQHMPLPTQRVSTPEQVRLVSALLAQISQEVEAAGARLSIVIVPHFPAAFYREERISSSYGLFADELALQRGLREWGVRGAVVPLGARFQELGLPTAEIRPLYLFDGSGHFSPAGHRFCAEQIHAALSGGAQP